MSDRIDELVQQVMDVFAHSQNPETDEWELSGDLDQYPSYVALTELATIAREASAKAKWIAEHWLHDSDPYEVCLHNDITVEDILIAAEKAVRRTTSEVVQLEPTEGVDRG